MQLRKTFYPIAVLIAIPLVIIVFYFLNQGKFDEQIHKENIEDENTKEKDVFIEYSVQWEGLGNPTIQDITFSGRDSLEITAAFIDSLEGEEIQVEEEQGAYRIRLPEQNIDHKQLKIVLQLSEEALQTENPVTSISIRYTTFGITRTQALPR